MTAPRHLLVAPDAAALHELAARRFVAAVGQAVAARGRAFVALAGGTTPRGLYELLAGPAFRDRLPWSSVTVFWGDERCVPPDDHRSNYGMARDALLAHVPLDPKQVHRIPGELAPPEAAAARYERDMETAFALRAADGAPPVFDLVLLGLGEDGHTASLFPGSPALKIVDRWTAAVRAAGGLDRITLTLPVLNAAREVHFLVSGESKAEVLRRIQKSDAPPGPECPASLVRPGEGRLLWLVDQPAASLLAL